MLAGCRLDASEKTACINSADCLDNRVCLAEQCANEPCPNLCARYCVRAQTCGNPVDNCTDTCPVEPSESQCKASFDELAELECDAIECLEQCVSVCDAALACALISDRDRCVDGCWAWNYCPTAATSCADVPNVSCYDPATPCA